MKASAAPIRYTNARICIDKEVIVVYYYIYRIFASREVSLARKLRSECDWASRQGYYCPFLVPGVATPNTPIGAGINGTFGGMST